MKRNHWDMFRRPSCNRKGSPSAPGGLGSEQRLTYEIPLPIGDVAADVSAVLVVQLQVDLRKASRQ